MSFHSLSCFVTPVRLVEPAQRLTQKLAIKLGNMESRIDAFQYCQTASRVIFGKGTVSRLAQELRDNNVTAPLILSTPGHQASAQGLVKLLLDSSPNPTPHVFAGATVHTPTHITNKAIDLVERLGVDGIVSVGGGSTIGLGKAIAVRKRLYHVAIPTTYSGSEMTPVLGETENGVKTTRRDPRILPNAVIYDVEFTMSLSARLSCVSGINAIAHAVEALYASDRNPITRLLAKEGARLMSSALRVIQGDPGSMKARTDALCAAWLCGVCLGGSETSLHHKLCHVVGALANLPHGETHAAILPHSVAYNMPSVPSAAADLAEALARSDGNACRAMNELLTDLDLRIALRDLGMKEEDIALAAVLATRMSYPNPRTVDQKSIEDLVRAAWSGATGGHVGSKV